MFRRALALAVSPTRNHRHWLEVDHGTIWRSSCFFPFDTILGERANGVRYPRVGGMR